MRAREAVNAVEITLDDLVRVSKLRAERGIGPECERTITRQCGEFRHLPITLGNM